MSSTDPHRPFLLLATGPFGDAALASLAAIGLTPITHDLAAAHVSSPDALDLLVSSSGAVAVVVALDRPRSGFLRRLDVLSHRYRVPWTSVLLDGTAIRVGPTVVPGRTPCWNCFRRRFLTNAESRRVELPLERFWDENPFVSPAGRLELLDTLGGALLAQEASLLLEGSPALAGRFRIFDPFASLSSLHPVTPVSWCPICTRVADPVGWSHALLSEVLVDFLVREDGHVQG